MITEAEIDQLLDRLLDSPSSRDPCRSATAPSSRVWLSPSRTVRVVARFLPVGLSVGVATSSASPSQSKDSGT